jgi:hypothetical protein
MYRISSISKEINENALTCTEIFLQKELGTLRVISPHAAKPLSMSICILVVDVSLFSHPSKSFGWCVLVGRGR